MAANERSGRPIAATLAVLAIVGGLAIAAYVAWSDSEDARIDGKRAHNLALHAAAQPLPGTPDLAHLPDRLTAAGLNLGAPIFMRVFKREFELELWIRRGDRFERFATYPVCNWSGRLGPKLREGDRQAPEGFYTVDAKALNPRSRWHRSFNLGFPNAFDRAHGRTGSLLMVHGGCSSVGCFAMTDAVIDEIWQIVTAALAGGQKRFHVHVFPFRMTAEALAAAKDHAAAAFWQSMKDGHDAFEANQQVPAISVCGPVYQIQAGSRPSAVDAAVTSACPG
jgi:murein L,D-transpeptidase YafK